MISLLDLLAEPPAIRLDGAVDCDDPHFLMTQSPRASRITISLTSDEEKEIEKLAKARTGGNVSQLLVQAVIPDRESFPQFIGDDAKQQGPKVEAVGPSLERGSLPQSYLDSLGPELQEAITDYKAAFQRGDIESDSGDGNDAFVPKIYCYPPCDAAIPFQEALRAAILTLPGIGKRIGGSGSASSEAHLARYGLVARRKVVYLYPFFRSPARRPFWGVIPFGHHKHIGLLLRREVTKGLVCTASDSEGAAYGWLGLILDQLCSHPKGFGIGFTESFFDEEVAEMMWSHAQTQFDSEFEVRRKPISPSKLQYNTAKFPALLNQQKIGLFVFDLFNETAIRSVIDSEWEIVRFPHWLNVPVGTGFSLSFLPRLLAFGNWKRIESAFKNLVPGIETDLLASGIAVKPDFQKGTST